MAVAMLVALAPTVAAAEPTVFSAPFPEVWTSKTVRGDGTALSYGSATVRASAETGSVFVDASGVSANPVGVGVFAGGAGGRAAATFVLPPFYSATGRFHLVATLGGSAEVYMRSLVGEANGQVEVSLACEGCGETGSTLLTTGTDGRLALAEERSEKGATFTVSGELQTAECPAGPATADLLVTVSASADAMLVSQAQGTGDLVLQSVSVEDLPCEVPPPPPPARADVSVQDYQFNPQELYVSVGTEVVWTWRGTHPHSVTADDGSFDSGEPQTQGEFRHVFESTGTFDYYCKVYGDPGRQGMWGTVTVN
ncbi:MAG: hypothetical protein HY814_13905 [Candidatus Riflebacteria bacterium]|nr:hypothetical protein [Candidatus Riflebacteria bacterium]